MGVRIFFLDDHDVFFPENTVRTVTENCRTLKFKNQGFEKE